MSRLIDIEDERFWDVLFDEACVEGNQAERIKNELEKIVAFDTEKVVEKIHDKYCHKCRNILGKQSSEEYCKSVKCEIDALCDIVKKGGVE